MNRAISALAATGFATLLVAFAPGSAIAQTSQAAAISGEAAYAENCAACHRTPARFMRRYTDKAAEQRQAELDKFLAGHYAPDPATRAAIIGWLEANHTGR
jgi:mono/diheme cytochrome c family protein